MLKKYNYGFGNFMGLGAVGLLVYLLLVWLIGISLVDYVLVHVFGHGAPAIIELILAFIFGFNFLIPVALIVWFLSLFGLHAAASFMVLQHFIK